MTARSSRRNLHALNSLRQISGKSREAQLKRKQKQAEMLLKEYGKVKPIIGMEEPAHYLRLRLEYRE